MRRTLKSLGDLIHACTPENQPSPELLDAFFKAHKEVAFGTAEERVMARLDDLSKTCDALARELQSQQTLSQVRTRREPFNPVRTALSGGNSNG